LVPTGCSRTSEHFILIKVRRKNHHWSDFIHEHSETKKVLVTHPGSLADSGTGPVLSTTQIDQLGSYKNNSLRVILWFFYQGI
jgi:hypothetical protein